MHMKCRRHREQEGDETGVSRTKITTVRAEIRFDGRVTGIGGGYITGGPGQGTAAGIGATYGGAGLGSSKDIYGNIASPRHYGSNGFGASSANGRGGGQVEVVVSDLLMIDGAIDVSGQNSAGSGGSILISTEKLAGRGEIRADGGEKSNSPLCPI